MELGRDSDTGGQVRIYYSEPQSSNFFFKCTSFVTGWMGVNWLRRMNACVKIRE